MSIFKDPAKRCEWIFGQPMERCPRCGSYNLKYQTPIKQTAEIMKAVEAAEFDPRAVLRAWARAKKSGHTELEGPSYLMCWDCKHKGPAVDCSGRTSEEVGQDKAVADEIKRLWNEHARQPGDNEYRCAVCFLIFTKDWSDEEAQAEKAEHGWQDVPDEECGLVCDDCSKKIRPRTESGE